MVGKRLVLPMAAVTVLTLTLVMGCARPSASGLLPACSVSSSIGYQIVPFTGGRDMAIWYPSDDRQTTYHYSRDVSTTLAFNGRPTSRCGPFPLIVFSHGLYGCGAQSLFFTEHLARQGYVVAAPDHADALCRVDGSVGSFSASDNPSIFDPQTWTAATYADRKDDVELAISRMLTGVWRQVSDPSRIGVVGHSLGGYTALGVVGGWSSWHDARIKAALLFSPYSLPFSIQKTLGNVRVPLMYQGGDQDVGITPFLEGPTGAYAQSNAPKYFVKLRRANHFAWTNVLCGGQKTIAACLEAEPNAQLIDDYGIAFLNATLKHQASALLVGNGAGLSAYIHQG